MNANEGMREQAGKLANLVFAQAGKSVARVLGLRYAANLATLLIVDCDQARLLRYLGPAQFVKLRDKSWEIVQVGKAKEATNGRRPKTN
jgi:hypothetical protein